LPLGAFLQIGPFFYKVRKAMIVASRTPADLRQEVREQVQLLAEYCRLFDGGAQVFAKPMATALRVLLHTNPKPKGNTRALLDHFLLRSGRGTTLPAQSLAQIFSTQSRSSSCESA
jgi:hypothetical protein